MATGTSLAYALREVGRSLQAVDSQVSGILFFTIGGNKSLEILERHYEEFFAGSGIPIVIVYFEGIFTVPDESTALSIKLPGTDLVRLQALMAPEFISFQKKHALYPLERCAIYDAGSRAFDVRHYLDDVLEYWREVEKFAESGLSYQACLQERMPELEWDNVENINLREEVATKLASLKKMQSQFLAYSG
ncbi:MAG: hypothetical protein KDD62_15160 [Bdellovibrionales bacterium]|nr:hypothetical protein [Bdellovibrionales bacterium]